MQIIFSIDSDAFNIDESTGVITIARSLDRETNSSFTLMVTASDQGDPSLSSTVSVTIAVLDVNDNAPEFPATPSSFRVSETARTGSHVGTVVAIDDDEASSKNSEVTYNITGGSGAEYFDLDPSNGNITVAAALDYETNASFELVITASDGGSPSLYSNKTFKIDVRNADDNNLLFTEDVFEISIQENNAIDDLIGQVEAEDPDPRNHSIGYAFATPQTLFTITATTGEIRAAVVFDRESHDSEYSFEVNVFYQDSSSNVTDTADVVVSIIDRNEFPIVLEAIADIELMENAEKGRVVRQVVASDDDADSDLRYTITIINDILGINSTTGKIFVNGEIDRESDDLFRNGGVTCPSGTPNNVLCQRFNVRVSDANSGEDPDRRGAYLLVEDQDDEPPSFSKDSYSFEGLSEDTATNYQLDSLNIEATDPDVGVSLMYSIRAEDEIEDFAIQSLSAVLYVAQSLDYEKNTSYNFTILAEDTGGNQGSSVVTISITDVNDNDPKFLRSDYNASIPEDLEVGSVVSVVAATDADSTTNEEITYVIGGGNAGGAFEIDGRNGDVTLKSALNRENASEYNLTIHAVDKGSSPRTGSVTLIVSITDIDDDQPYFVASEFQGVVVETASPGDPVEDGSTGNPLQLTAVDLDEDSTVEIITFGFGIPFTVDSATGNVTVSEALDAEDQSQYQFTVVAKDNLGLYSAPATVTINIRGTNDHAPEFDESSYEVSVEENARSGEVILEVTATDRDFGDRVMYSLQTDFNASEVMPPPSEGSGESSGDVEFPFEFNTTTGAVSLLRSLDYETLSTWEFNVTATDKDGVSTVVTVTINVVDLNDNSPRFSEDRYDIMVSENASVSDTVPVSMAVRATDADSVSEDNLQYFITRGGEGTFTMDRETGDIFLATTLDQSTNPTYRLELFVTDGDNHDTTIVVVMVTDINNNDPVFEEDSYSASLPENATEGYSILQVVAEDADSGKLGRVSYAIDEGNTTLFRINATTGEISTNAGGFDADTPPENYELTILAMDSGVPMRSASVVVDIILDDVNDNQPTFTSDSSFEVSEDTSIGTSVFRVTASDADSGTNQEVYFEVQTEDSFFSIDRNTGVVRIARQLDFDNSSLPNPIFVSVAVTDKGEPPLSSNGSLSVNITDSNDNSPAFSSSLIQAFVAENTTVNDTAFVVEATDADSGNNARLTYEILTALPTECNSRYRIISSTGVIILNEPVDAEERDEPCNLLVRATDGGSPSRSSTATYNVIITNINENPPVFIPESPVGSVPEQSQNGTSVLTLVTEDSDGNDVRYKALDGATSLFDVGSDGLVTVARGAVLDRETADTYTLTVEARDDGSPRLSSTATVTITITDLNDNPPVFLQDDYFLSVRENFPEEVAFGYIRASDVDIGSNDDVEYSLVPNVENKTDYGLFNILEGTGELFLTSSLDYETQQHYYVLSVLATDGKFEAETSVHIRVLESNDITPMFNNLPSSTTIPENADNGTFIFQVSAQDGDLGVNGDITFSLMNTEGSDKFTVDSETGVILVYGSMQFDFESDTREFELLVVATDNAGATPSGDNEAASGSAFGDTDLFSPNDTVRSNTSMLTVRISDFNDNSPLFSRTSYSTVIVEHEGISLFVTSVSATDADEPGTPNSEVRYRIISGARGRFSIGNDGIIFSNPPIDREENPFYYLVVEAYDQGNPPQRTTVNVTVTVFDSNDERPVFTGAPYSATVEENSPLGVSVVQVKAIDRDAVTDPLNYTLFDSSGHFQINISSGLITTTNQPIDREDIQSVSMMVRASDVSGFSDNADVTVTVTDVNDERPIFETRNYFFNLSENLAEGTRLAGVEAVDKDAGSNAVTHYEMDLESGRSGFFEIDSTTGEIVVITPPCFSSSAKEVYTFNLRATDSADNSLTDTASLTLSLDEENDSPPEFVQPSYVSRLNNLASNGTEIIPDLRTTDKDVCSGSPVFSIVNGNDNNTFSIIQTTGRITLTRDLTDSDLTFTLTVMATDTGNFGLADRSSNVTVIVLIGQLLPVSVTVDTGLTAFPIFRLSQYQYVQDIWLFDGGSLVEPLPTLTYSLTTLSETLAISVEAAEATNIMAAISQTEVYPDNPEVVVGVQVSGPNYGRTSVRPTDIYVVVSTNYPPGGRVEMGSCRTEQETGSCVVHVSLPSSWFVQGSTTASVFIGQTSSADAFLGNVSIVTPSSCPPPSDTQVRVQLPSRVLFPGSLFNATVYAQTEYDISYFLLTFSLDARLEAIGIADYPVTYSIQSGSFGSTFSVTAYNTQVNSDPQSSYRTILTLQLRLKPDASILNSDVLSLNATVEYLVTADSREVLTNEPAVHVGYDEDGSCNSTIGSLLVAIPTVVKLFPYSNSSVVLNTAYLNSERVAWGIMPYGFLSSGEFTDSVKNLRCESEDSNVLKVEYDCSEVYLTGNETSGADRVTISIFAPENTTSLAFRVWFPMDVTITPGNTELSKVFDVFETASCDSTYESTSVAVVAAFTAGRSLLGKQVATITPIVSNLLRSSNGDILELKIDSTTETVRAVGKLPGFAHISLNTSSFTATSRNIEVHGLSVTVEDINFSLHTSLSPSILPAAVVGESYFDKAQVTLLSELDHLNTAVSVLTEGVLSNGRNFELSDSNGLVLQSLDEDIITILSNRDIVVRGSGTGLLLRGYLNSTHCSLSTSTHKTDSVITVTLNTITGVTASVGATRLATLNHTYILGLPTETSLEVVLSHEDGTEIAVTDDVRTTYTASGDAVTVNSKGAILSTNTPGLTNITAVYTSADAVVSDTVNVVEVVGITSLELFASPDPSYPDSELVSATTLQRYPVTGSLRYQEARLHVVASVSDGTTLNITDREELVFSVFNSAALEQNGVVVRGMNPGNAAVTVRMGSLTASLNFTILDSLLDVTAITEFDVPLDSGNILSVEAGSDVVPSLTLQFDDGRLFPSFLSSSGPALGGLLSFYSSDLFALPIDATSGVVHVTRNSLSTAGQLTATVTSQTSINSEITISQVDLIPKLGEVDISGFVSQHATNDIIDVMIYVNAEGKSLGAGAVTLSYDETTLVYLETQPGADLPPGSLSDALAENSSGTVKLSFVTNKGFVGERRMHMATLQFTVYSVSALSEFEVTVNNMNEYSPTLATIGEPVPRISVAGSHNFTVPSRKKRELTSPPRCSTPPCSKTECLNLDTYSPVGDVNGDCIFDVLDVLALHIYSAEAPLDTGKFTAAQLYAMDADRNGRIDIKDVTFLLSASVGRFPLVAELFLRPIDVEYSNCVLAINTTLWGLDGPAISSDTFVYFGLFHPSTSFQTEYAETVFSKGTKLSVAIPLESNGGWSEPEYFGDGVYGIETLPGNISQTGISFVIVYGTVEVTGPTDGRTTFLVGPPTLPLEYSDLTAEFTLGGHNILIENTGFNGLRIFNNSFRAVDCYNNYPPEISPQGTSIHQRRENTLVGTVIETASAEDRDSPRTAGDIRFSLDGLTIPGALAIDTVSGAISIASSLDREKYEEVRAVVVATDQGPHIFTRMSDSYELVLTVTDVNDNPPRSEQEVYVVNISEAVEVPEGGRSEPIFHFTGSDVDESPANQGISSISISYNGSDVGSIFNVETLINGNTFTARLVLLSPLDFENRTFYNLTLTITDAGSNPSPQSSETHIELYVVDANDERPRFSSPTQTGITENNAPGAEVIQLMAVDADSGDNAKFRFEINNDAVFEADDDGVIVSGSSLVGIFSLDPNTGVLRAQQTLDREGKHSFVIPILAREEGITTGVPVHLLWVMVCEENDNRPIFSPNLADSVDENSPNGTVVTTLKAQDLDNGSFCGALDIINNLDNVVQYSLVTASVPFLVERESGNILVTGQLDFEQTQNYTLEVVAFDLGFPPRNTTANVTIAVLDTNDHAPILSSDSYSTFAIENSTIGRLVYDGISATDEDTGLNMEIRYELFGEGSGDFDVDSLSGILTVARSLDRETRDKYYLTVFAYNLGVRSQNDTASLEIEVFDINDNKPIFNQSAYYGTIKENASPGTPILTVVAMDVDISQNNRITYRLENHPPFFAINNITGELFSTGSLCVSVDTDYTFAVVAEDRPLEVVVFENSTNVTIRVEDENLFAPMFDRNEYGVVVPNGIGAGEFVTSVSARDRDPCSLSFRYFITEQPVGEVFRMEETSGHLVTSAVLSSEVQDFYTITVSAVDTDTLNPRTAFATVYVVVGSTIPVGISINGGFPVSGTTASSDRYTYEQNYDYFYDIYMGSIYPGEFTATFGPFTDRRQFLAAALPATKLAAFAMTPTVYFDNRTVVGAVQALDEFNSYSVEDTEVYMRVERGSESINVTGKTSLVTWSSTWLTLTLPEEWFLMETTEATVSFGITGQSPLVTHPLTLVPRPNFMEVCANKTSDLNVIVLLPASTIYASQAVQIPILAQRDANRSIASLSYECSVDDGLEILNPPGEENTPYFRTTYTWSDTLDYVRFSSFRADMTPFTNEDYELVFTLRVRVSSVDSKERLGVFCRKIVTVDSEGSSETFSVMLSIDRWGCFDNGGDVHVSRGSLAAAFPSIQETVIYNTAVFTGTRNNIYPQVLGYILDLIPYPVLLEQTADIICSSSDPTSLRTEDGSRCILYVDGTEAQGAKDVDVSINATLPEDFTDFEIASNVFPVSILVQVWFPDLPINISTSDSILNAVAMAGVTEGGSCSQLYQRTQLKALATFRLGVSVTVVRVEHLLQLVSGQETIIEDTEVVGRRPGVSIVAAINIERGEELGLQLGSVDITVSEDPVRPVLIEVFHGAGVEAVTPDSIPYEGSFPFQVDLDPGLQYETGTAQLLSSVLFSDGTRYNVSDLVQYYESIDSDVLSLTNSQVTVESSGVEELLVNWSSCAGTVFSQTVPLSVSLFEPIIRIVIGNRLLVLPDDPATALSEFTSSTSVRVYLVYNITGDTTKIDITNNALTNINVYPPNSIRLSPQADGSLLLEPLASNLTVSLSASYQAYPNVSETFSIASTSSLSVTAYHYPPYNGSSEIEISELFAIGNTGSFQRAQLQAVLEVIIPGEGSLYYHVSSSAETNFYRRPGASFTYFQKNVIIPNSIGAALITARFNGEERDLTINVRSEDISVVSIDNIALSSGDTLSGQKGSVAGQLSVEATFSDGSKIENVYESGSQVISALFTAVTSDRSVATVSSLTGELTIWDNAAEEISVTVTANDQFGLQNSFSFYSNLQPSPGELDLGDPSQAAANPVNPGDSFSVPVYVSVSSSVSAIEVAVVYSSPFLTFVSAARSDAWKMVGTHYETDTDYFFSSSENEYEGFVHLGGIFHSPQSGLIHVATLNFVAREVGFASIKANFILLLNSSQDLSELPLLSSHSPSSPAADIGVIIGLPTTATRPDVTIPLNYLQPSVPQCNSRPCTCGVGREMGDINKDCVLNLADVVSLAFNTAPCNENLDVNRDGVCNFIDVGFLLRIYFRQTHFFNITISPVNTTDCFLTIRVQLVSKDNNSPDPDRTSVLVVLTDSNPGSIQWFANTVPFLDRGEQLPLSPTTGGFIPATSNTAVFLANTLGGGQYEAVLNTPVVSPALGVSLVQIHRGFARQFTPNAVTLLVGDNSIPLMFPVGFTFNVSHPWAEITTGPVLGFSPLATVEQTLNSPDCINVNEPQFIPNRTVVEFYENATISTLIATVFANDSDAGPNAEIRYSFFVSTLTAEIETTFSINATTGEVMLISSLDRESVARYDIGLHAVDQGTLFSLGGTGELIVHVLDVNDNNPEFSKDVYVAPLLREDARIGDHVITVVAVDQDEDYSLTYTLQDPLKFAINESTGTISVQSKLDFETTISYNLTVIATDSGGLQGNTTVVVQLEPVNDNLPQCLEPALALVLENSFIGTVIHTVTAIDRDIGLNHNDLTFELTEPSSEFAVQKVGDTMANIVTLNDTFDRRAQHQYSLEVLVRDVGGNNCTAYVTVIVAEPSTLDIEIFGANAVGTPVRTLQGFQQEFSFFSTSSPTGNITATLGGVSTTVGYSLLRQPISSLQGILLSRTVWFDYPRVSAVGQAKDSSMNIITGADLYIEIVPSSASSSEGAVGGPLCQTPEVSGACTASIDVPSSWFGEYSTINVSLVAGSEVVPLGSVELRARLTLETNSSNLFVGLPSFTLLPGQSFAITVGAPPEDEIVAFEMSITVPPSVTLGSLSDNNWRCGISPNGLTVYFTCLRSPPVVAGAQSETFPGELFFSIHATVADTIPSLSSPPVAVIVKTLVSRSGPIISRDTPALVIDRNGFCNSPGVIYLRPPATMGYIGYASQAELNNVRVGSVAVQLFAVRVRESGPDVVSLVNNGFTCDLEGSGMSGENVVTIDEATCVVTLSNANTEGSEETSIVVQDGSSFSFSISLRVWLLESVRLFIPDPVLNLVSDWYSDTCQLQYQRTNARAYGQFTTGTRMSTEIDVTAFVSLVSSDPNIVRVDGSVLTGVLHGSAEVWVEQFQSSTVTMVEVVTDEVQPHSLLPRIFTDLEVVVVPEQFNPGSKVVALASASQIFSKVGTVGQVAATVYFTDGSRYEVPTNSISVLSFDPTMATTEPTGSVEAVGDGMSLIEVSWTPKNCPSSQTALLHTNTTVTVTTPYPIELTASSSASAVLRDSQNVPISSIPPTATITAELVYTDGRRENVTAAVAYTSPSLIASFNVIPSNITVTANTSSSAQSGVVYLSYSGLTAEVTIRILDVHELRISLIPYPNEAQVEVGMASIELKQIGSTGYWQQAELLTEALFSDGTTEIVTNPLIANAGAGVVTLRQKKFVIPIEGAFGTNQISAISGTLESSTVDITVIDSTATVASISLTLEHTSRYLTKFVASVFFTDGTQINDVAAFRDEIGDNFLDYTLTPPDIGTIDITAGTVTISSNYHHDYVQLTATAGDVETTAFLAANFEPSIGEVDLGYANGVPLPTAAIGVQFPVNIRINTGGVAIGALDIVLTYDPTRLTAIGVGTPLHGFSVARIDSPSGELQLVVTSAEVTSEEIPTVATVIFMAEGDGLVGISSYLYILTNSAGDPISSTSTTDQTAYIRIQGSSAGTSFPAPAPTTRDSYLPPASLASFADINQDGAIDIRDANAIFNHLVNMDSTTNRDTNWDGVMSIRDTVYMSRASAGLVPFLLAAPTISQPMRSHGCQLTFEQTLFSFSPPTLFAIISHPNISTDLPLALPQPLVSFPTGSGVFALPLAVDLGESMRYTLSLFSSIDIRDTPIGYTVIAFTTDASGVHSPDRLVQFVSGQGRFTVGNGELIPSIAVDSVQVHVGEPDGFSPLSTFTVSGLRSDYCQFDGSTIPFSVAENIAPGSVFAMVSAVNHDLQFPSREEVYALVAASNPGVFLILPDGRVQLNSTLDFETLNSYTLSVSAERDGYVIGTATINITILDANDFAPSFVGEPYNVSVVEHSGVPRDLLSIMAEDEEAGLNGMFYFELDEESDPFDQFKLVENTPTSVTLVVQRDINRELNSDYDLVVRVIDRGTPPLNSTTIVKVTVLDINDNAPMFDSDVYSVNISEAAEVGGEANITIGVMDLDNEENGTWTLSLDPDSTQFNITTDGIIVVNSSLDREMRALYEFIVVAADQGNPPLSSSVPLTITVLDVNDNAPVLQLVRPNLPIVAEEDSRIGSTVAQFTAPDADKDVNARVTYSLAEPNLPFAIDTTSGHVVLSQPISVSLASKYRVTVVARDGGDPQLNDTFASDIYIIEGQVIAFQVEREEAYLVGEYVKSEEREYSQDVGYILGVDIGTAVEVRGTLNDAGFSHDVTEVPNTGGPASSVHGATLQTIAEYSRKTLTVFVQTFDSRGVIAEPTTVRVRVSAEGTLADSVSNTAAEGFCTTSPELGYCIAQVALPESWFARATDRQAQVYASLISDPQTEVDIGTASIQHSPAYSTDLTVNRVLLVPPGYDILEGRNFVAEVYVISPLDYELYNRIDFDVDSSAAELLGVSSSDTWDCSKSLSLSLSHTHTPHIHTHIHTHTHTPSCCLPHYLS